MAPDISVQLNYMRWNEKLHTEKPYQLVSDDLPEIYGVPRQNFEIQPAPKEHIKDVRGEEWAFNLDDQGFTFLNHTFPKLEFENESEVEFVYKPEVEKLLKSNIAGVDEVCFFNWRLRANRREKQTEKLGNIGNPVDLLVPAHFVHLDQTLKTTIDYVREYRPDRADWLLQGRVRIFNIWKPFSVPRVLDCPLAVCDGSTIRREDMIVCDNVTKARVGELILPLYNMDARWHYLSEQTPDEVTIMKIVDSDTSVKAPYCPHTAFDIEGVDPSTPLRKSIEMRALIFTYPA